MTLVLSCCLVACTNPAMSTDNDVISIEGGLGSINGDETGNSEEYFENANGVETDNEEEEAETANDVETDIVEGNGDSGIETGNSGQDNEDNYEIPHVHVAGDWIVTQTPACEENGMKEVRCTEDDEVLETELIPATGHSWNDEWEQISVPDETHNGIEAVICASDPSHIRETRVFAYATGTEGLVFTLTAANAVGGAYKVSGVTGNAVIGPVYIPAFWLYWNQHH